MSSGEELVVTEGEESDASSHDSPLPLAFCKGDYIMGDMCKIDESDNVTLAFFNPTWINPAAPHFWRIIKVRRLASPGLYDAPYLVQRGLDGEELWCTDEKLQICGSPDFDAMAARSRPLAASRTSLQLKRRRRQHSAKAKIWAKCRTCSLTRVRAPQCRSLQAEVQVQVQREARQRQREQVQLNPFPGMNSAGC